MRTRTGIVAAALLLAVSPAWAELAVFQGDPIDPNAGTPYVLLPGVPLVYPGPDGEYGTGDDVVDTQITGDVDLVVRTQGAVDAGVIPPPVVVVGAAPLVVVGGEHGNAGTRLAFQVIVSDGATPPAAGSALADPGLDLHGALVLAYPDLDGDGVIGPTGAPGAALEVQRQETLQTAGRRPALFIGGIAADSMGVSLGAPASVGGLGLVLAAVGTTGATPGLFLDGPWIATALPYMLPLDPATYFDSDGEPSADGIVEVELEREALLLPTPGDPILGGSFALPLDGSSPTIDLARSISGPVASAVLALPVDPATFVADFARRLLPVFDALGARTLAEAVDTLDLPDDGPGSTRTVLVFLADLLGNATDPAGGGTSVVVEVGPSLRIVTPDDDGDPQRETVPFVSAAFTALVIDDAGTAGDGLAQDRVVARIDGVPVASVRIAQVGGAPTPTATPTIAPTSTAGATLAPTPAATPFAVTSARANMARARTAAHDRIAFTAVFSGDPQTIDPATQAITLVLQNRGGVVYARTIAAGALVPNKARTSFVQRGGDTSVVVRRPRRLPTKHVLRIVVTHLDLGSADLGAPDLTVAFGIGDAPYEGTLVCRVAKSQRSARCLK